MPPKPKTPEELEAMRNLFNLVVDGPFNGNVNLAAKHLKIPASTAHQYRKQGPKTIGYALYCRLYIAKEWWQQYEKTATYLRKANDELLKTLTINLERRVIESEKFV